MDGIQLLEVLAARLDDLDGRRVRINHTIEHVDRVETVTTRAPAHSTLARAARLRAKQALAAM